MSAMLEVTDLRAGYGQSEVLHDVSLHVEAGEIVCLLGPNGAGKTTLMRAITGLIRARAGTVKLDGRKLTNLPAHRRVEAGIALSPEGRQVFPDLTVRDNLLLGSFSRRARPHRERLLEQVLAMFPRLAERLRQRAGLMSGGEQQMLAIGRALMASPRLLLLDEPSLGLAPRIVSLVLDSIAIIGASGTSILLVEQNVHAALSIASRGYILAEGRIAFSDTAPKLLRSELVQEAFLRRRARELKAAEAHA